MRAGGRTPLPRRQRALRDGAKEAITTISSASAAAAIVEFEEDRIEALQEQIAKRLGFRFTGHKMELYGVCRDCQKRQRA